MIILLALVSLIGEPPKLCYGCMRPIQFCACAK